MTEPVQPVETNRRVLVVEDSRDCRRLIRRHLEMERLLVFEAIDELEGQHLSRALQPDLILLDLIMPNGDGFALLRSLKEDPRTRGIPVIFLSGQATVEQRAEGLDLGAVDFVSKPFHGRELRARVRSALRAKHRQELLERLAHLDGLTSLGNRLALEERLDAAWSHGQRRRAPLAVLLADLDHFKLVNDLYGHGVGDQVLRCVAQVLREQVRHEDFVARYGGEEFVIVALDSDEAGALEMAERCRAAVAARTAALSVIDRSVTISIGLATECDLTRSDPRVLLSRADRALYQAKLAGRNAVWYWADAESSPRAAVPRRSAAPVPAPPSPS